MKAKVDYQKTEDLFDLKNKITLIFGIGGIGSNFARAFAENGTKLIAADIDEKALQQLKEDLETQNLKVETYKMDVTKKSDIEAVVNKVVKEFGGIDVFINTSGIAINQKAVEFREEDVDRILDINLKGTILGCQLVGQAMVKQGKGKIINIGSIGGHMTHTLGSMPYAASKAGVHQVTRSFAGELAKDGVNVNAIAPSWVNTPMMKGKSKSYYESISKNTPFGRMLYPEELIGTAIFLATDSSNFITGQTIFVDGGWSTVKPAA